MPKKKRKDTTAANRSGHLRPVASGPTTDAAVLRQFASWYRNHVVGLDGHPSPEQVDEAMVHARELTTELGRQYSLSRPVAPMLRMLLDLHFAEKDHRWSDGVILDALDHFLIFLDETDRWFGTDDEFAAATALLYDEIEADPGVLTALMRGVEQVPDVPSPQQLAALGELVPIAAVEPLLEWVGRSKKVTPSGGARLSDIRPLGEMLGIRVLGKQGAGRPFDHLLFEGAADSHHAGRTVGSMWDVPELSAWWRALLAVGVLETTATTVRPGPYAAAWLTPDPDLALELRARLLSDYLAYWFNEEIDSGTFASPLVLIRLFAQLSAAVCPDLRPELSNDDLDHILDQASELASIAGIDIAGIAPIRARRVLRYLERAGIVSQRRVRAGTRYQVPVAVRPVIAIALREIGRELSGRSTARGSEHPVGSSLQLKVALVGTKPAVWRRLVVAADETLEHLHVVIQVAFGWSDSHLHEFTEDDWFDDEVVYGSAETEEFLSERAEFVDEADVAVGAMLLEPGDELFYLYDFGDSWRHIIRLEKIIPGGADAAPRCTGGRGANAAEDSGGISGWADMIQTSADPEHPDHADIREWLGLEAGEELNASAFDPAATDRSLGALRD